MTRAFTFPGQGSQKIGMGADLAAAFREAREVFEEVDDALDQNLSRLIWQGEEADLTLTENAQPALMAVSMAVVRVLEAQAGLDIGAQITCVAGHSLGEYSALAAAGSFRLDDAARALKARGLAMQQAVPVGKGAMAAVLGLEITEVEAVLADLAGDDVCEIANDNAPGQVVISGAADAVARAIEAVQEAGARRAIPLPVSAPFHCALMAPAAEAMERTLEEIEIAAPAAPLISNVTAAEIVNTADIKQRLVEQVTGRVRWRESVAHMAQGGVTHIHELGAGKVLTGLAKRIAPDLEADAISGPDDVERLAAALQSRSD